MFCWTLMVNVLLDSSTRSKYFATFPSARLWRQQYFALSVRVDSIFDYVYEHDCVAELWMQVADQTSRLESVRNPYTVQIECTMNTFLCQ